MTDTHDAGGDLLTRLRAFVGKPDGAPVVARDPVNLPMIRHWCDALGDRNPAYADGATVPPAMLQTWCRDRGPDSLGVVGEVMRVLTDAGYPSVVATDYEQEYARPLRLGDLLSEEAQIEDVSPLKRTALGDGHFVTIRYTYRDAAGNPVGTSRMRVLRFRAATKPAVPARPRPPVNEDTEFFWAGAARGELLAQRCTSCGLLRHPPAPMCGACGALGWDTVRLSGRGTVHSWVVHHHPPLPGFDLPVTVVLADLEEGVRLVAELGEGASAVHAGMPVEVEFVPVDADLALPRFRVVPG